MTKILAVLQAVVVAVGAPEDEGIAPVGREAEPVEIATPVEPEPSVPSEPKPSVVPTARVVPQARVIPEPAPPAIPRRGLRISGITIGLVGLAGTATGIALMVLPDQHISGEPAFVKTTQPAGVMALTIGIGLTVTGVLMLVASSGKPRVAAQAKTRIDGRGVHF